MTSNKPTITRCTWDSAIGLPANALDAYEEDGVLVIENFVTANACSALRQRAEELVQKHAPTGKHTVFSTQDQGHARNAYFEQSANGIGVFFEEGAHDANGNLTVPLAKAVNKIGHAMHDLDPVFDAFSRTADLASVASSLGLIDPLLVQSMYIFKQPGIGGEVNCHQDSTYLYTQPSSVIGFWFAIENAHIGNGCLKGIAGSHRHGLREIFRRQQGGKKDGQLALEVLQPDLQWDTTNAEWLEVKQGTLIVFNGLFAHLSSANRSEQSRHAYTLHAVSGRAHYPGSNWIQRGDGLGLALRGFDASAKAHKSRLDA
jgi:phytanoyl-CoA hydroxylase